jgi:hypothetical protein
MSFYKYTADELVSTVRLHAGLPNSGQLGTTNSEIIQILNEQMWTRLVPGVIKTREDYFIISRRFTVNTTTKRVRIPPRAVGLRLRTAFGTDSSGNRTKMTRVDSSDIYKYAGTRDSPHGFYVEGSDIVIIGEAPTQVELSFQCRPGALVPVAETALVTAVDLTLLTATLASTPMAFSGTLRYDVHGGESGAEIKQLSVLPAGINSSVMTFNEAIDGSVAGTKPIEVGDYICLTGEAALPGLPVELHIALALAAAVSILSTLDPELSQVKQQELQTVLSLAGYYIDSRMESHPQKVVNSSAINR